MKENYDLTKIKELALKVLGSEEAVNDWMSTKIPALKNESPLSHLSSSDSEATENIISILKRIEYGIYS